jgi:iron complex outermembrane recepter protein
MSSTFRLRGRAPSRLASFAVGCALAAPVSAALAQTAIPLPSLTVVGSEPDAGLTLPLGSTTLFGNDSVSGSDDTAARLGNLPGLGVAAGGGFSGRPVIHGLADDRIKTLVSGVPIAAACPNHMNPALSTISLASVARIDVIAGITPVSAGGDSIGGTISVEKAQPEFAAPGDGFRSGGEAGVTYRSNTHGFALSGNVAAATERLSIAYDGSWSQAGDYHRGGDGAPVRATAYQVENHALTLAARTDDAVVSLEGGWHYSPYEGFANQVMDSTENKSPYANLRYRGDLAWGSLDVRAYWRDVEHEMNFLDGVKGDDMPMNTRSRQLGYSVKAEIPLSDRDTLRLGNEFDRFRLDDWWPAVDGSMMMGPEAFWNVNDGLRSRLGTYAEWETRLSERWTTLLGVRNDTVWSDAGEVQGYNAGATYATDAAAFNAADRSKTDVNFDVTALARYTADKTVIYEGGYARKTRSPSLYERYTWSTSAMGMSMNNWLGDGNGYVGDIDLKPEVAHTFSIGADWHDADRRVWGLKVTPYYTYVQDYIDADRLAVSSGTTNDFVRLRLANHDAQLYGVDMSGELQAWDSAAYGRGMIKASLGWVNGENLDTGDNLYNVMPLSGRIALEHRQEGWTNIAEVTGASTKTAVSHVRNEAQTPGYVLVNLRSSYDWESVSVGVGVENLFDRRYHMPLGGADLVSGGWGVGTYGEGRSYVATMTMRF